jgi:ABC-2 type transport system permease protein
VVAVLLVRSVAFALTSLGLLIAWRMESYAGLPRDHEPDLDADLILSVRSSRLRARRDGSGWIMRLNPLTYGMAAVRRTLYSQGAGAIGAWCRRSAPACW